MFAKGGKLRCKCIDVAFPIGSCQHILIERRPPGDRVRRSLSHAPKLHNVLGEPVRIVLRGRTQETLIYPVIGLRAGDPELYRTDAPLVLGEAPLRQAQDIADELIHAAEEGHLDEVAAQLDAEALVQQSLKNLGVDGEPGVNGHNGNGSSAATSWHDEPQSAASQPE